MAETTKQRKGRLAVPAASRVVAALEHEVRELRSELDDLRQANRLKDEYLAVATHELSAPLASIKAYVEALLEHHRDPAFDHTEEFLQVLAKETARLIRVVDRTLEISRLTRRSANLQRGLVDLAEVVDDVALSLQPVLAERSMTLEAELPPELPVIDADRDLLKQVLVNLIHNAVKFSPSGKMVKLRAGRSGDVVEVEVRDEGFGIAAAELGRIFEPYFRSGDARVARERGTGLGLSVVKTIVEQHGGRVWVESQPDRGTSFRFTLPLAG
jgi:two-component system phosphate regulon sensor histidine kinase PhoR